MLRRSLVVTLFVALSLLMFSLGAFAFHDFSDVDSAAFYHDDAHWLKEMGITLGCGGTLFCPNDPVTRGQMAAFLHRASRVHELPGFALTTLDSTGNVGWYTSVAVGVDGRPLISYFDAPNFDLKVAHCNDLACGAATITTLDSAGLVGLHTSITIGADGLGLISYFDNTNFDLKVAHCSNAACTAATGATLDSAGNVGQYTSITIGADGRGLISYLDGTNLDVKVAHCSDASCTAATLTAISKSRIASISSAAPRRSRRSTARATSAGIPRSPSAPMDERSSATAIASTATSRWPTAATPSACRTTAHAERRLRARRRRRALVVLSTPV